MISLTPLIQHLTPKPAGFAHAWFRDVAGAAEFAQVRQEALPLPACWLVRANDKTDDVDVEGLAVDVALGFDVVIAIANTRTQRAGETDDVLLDYRHAVRAKLQGWEIEADIRPLSFKGGRVLEYTTNDIYWADRYTFNALLTNYLPDPGPYSELVYTGAPAL
jgi:hypothetical protein